MHLSNKPGSEETSPRTNDCTEFISSNHFSNTTGWTGQPVQRFKTSSETFCDNKSTIMSYYHTSARDKTDSTTLGKSQQTKLLNSACISLPKNVNTSKHLLFTSLHYCVHFVHWMEDKFTGVSLASLHMTHYFSRLMFFEDLLSFYKPWNMTTTTEMQGRKILIKDKRYPKGSKKGHTLPVIIEVWISSHKPFSQMNCG